MGLFSTATKESQIGIDFLPHGVAVAQVQTLESLDWKLLWDEFEIRSDEYPKVAVKVAISTLSTRKQWVGI